MLNNQRVDTITLNERICEPQNFGIQPAVISESFSQRISTLHTHIRTGWLLLACLSLVGKECKGRSVTTVLWRQILANLHLKLFQNKRSRMCWPIFSLVLWIFFSNICLILPILMLRTFSTCHIKLPEGKNHGVYLYIIDKCFFLATVNIYNGHGMHVDSKKDQKAAAGHSLSRSRPSVCCRPIHRIAYHMPALRWEPSPSWFTTIHNDSQRIAQWKHWDNEHTIYH